MSGGIVRSFRITVSVFVDDVVIFVKANKIFAEALKSLSEEADPLGLRVSWITIKVQTFGDTLHATTELIPVSSKNVEVTHMITYIHNVIYFSPS